MVMISVVRYLKKGSKMAEKRYFKIDSDYSKVEKKLIEYKCACGFALKQKLTNIQRIHEAIKKREEDAVILEISSKSQDDLGVKLSAFNLGITDSNGKFKTVESIFQGSKVFGDKGPYRDLIYKSSLEAKKDPRIRESGELTGFRYRNEENDEDEEWPLDPITFFYDWVYINVLDKNVMNENISLKELLKYNTFTDVEFNHNKSLNCQAGAVALYLVLHEQNLLDKYLYDRDKFREAVEKHYVEVDKPAKKSSKKKKTTESEKEKKSETEKVEEKKPVVENQKLF